MNNSKVKLIIIFSLLLCNYGRAQQSTGYSFMTKEDMAFLKNGFGELSFSRNELQIDQFIIFQNYIFTTSIKEPGIVKIYDSNQLLTQELKFKNENKDSFIGLYKLNGKLYYNPRPNSSKYYSINLKKGKWTKTKFTLDKGKNKKIFFGKTIMSPNSQLSYFDTYGIRDTGGSIESIVTIKKNQASDTLLSLRKENTSVLQPYSSWTYDIAFNKKNHNYFIQDFRNGIIYSIDEMGIQTSMTKLKEMNDLEKKVIYSFFGGNYKFHSKILIDDANMKTYLYFGTKSKNKTQGRLYRWNNDKSSWQKVNLFLPSTKEPFPFIDIYEIYDNKIYFPLNIVNNKEGIYVTRLKD